MNFNYNNGKNVLSYLPRSTKWKRKANKKHGTHNNSCAYDTSTHSKLHVVWVRRAFYDNMITHAGKWYMWQRIPVLSQRNHSMGHAQNRCLRDNKKNTQNAVKCYACLMLERMESVSSNTLSNLVVARTAWYLLEPKLFSWHHVPRCERLGLMIGLNTFGPCQRKGGAKVEAVLVP